MLIVLPIVEKNGDYTIAHHHDKHDTYIDLTAATYPLADVIDFDTNFAGVIYNPLSISPLQIPA